MQEVAAETQREPLPELQPEKKRKSEERIFLLSKAEIVLS